MEYDELEKLRLEWAEFAEGVKSMQAQEQRAWEKYIEAKDLYMEQRRFFNVRLGMGEELRPVWCPSVPGQETKDCTTLRYGD
jgi:hypothetical protein